MAPIDGHSWTHIFADAVYSNIPAASPSSYRNDDSFLQRAIEAGHTSLRQGGRATDADASRTGHGQANPHARRPSSGGFSRRLSPTMEVQTPAPDDEAELDLSGNASGAPKLPPSHIFNGSAVAAVTETTPLLPQGQPSPADVALPDAPLPTAARQEVGVLFGYMIPVCFTHFLEYSLLVVTVVSVGHLGTVELAACSLGSMTASVIALSIIQGFCTALDTLCPAAYTSKPKDTSLYAMRTYVIILMLIVPQLVIFWNMEKIFLLLRQDPDVAAHASLYLRYMGFGLPGYAGFEVLRRWLQAQGLMIAPVVSLIVAAPFNVFLNWLLVWGPAPFRLGFVGAPLSVAFSMNLMFVVSIIYTYFAAPRDAWGGFTWAIFQDLGINFWLGLSGTAMVASEWWCWEIVGIASSYLGPTTLAAQSVLITSASFFYQIPYALSVAAAVRIGNLMGAQKGKRARVASRVVMGMAVVIAGVNSLILVALRHVWGRLFSSEEEVIKLVAKILPLVALFQLTDGLSGATGGILRGAGRAPLGAWINLASYYVVGLPLGLVLSFVGPKLGLVGLWVGLTVALTGTATLSSAFVWHLNWEQEVINTLKRLGIKPDEEAEED